MARNSRQKEPEPEPEDVGLDEVDEFAKEQEKITLEKAGWDGKDESSEEESDGEQAVMDINDSGDDDEENSAAKAEIEAYRKKLQGPIDEDEEAYFVDKGEAERYLEEGSGSGKAGQKDGEEDEDEAWGDSKGEYYGAEDLDEEDEEDAKATEKEALKIQKKHLEDLNMEDYMIDETLDEWKSEKKSKDDDEEKGEASLKSKDLSKVDAITRKKLFKRRYPEFIPLTKEYRTLKEALTGLTKRRDGKNEVVEIKFATLSSYLGIIATYFALFLSKLQAEDQFSMKNEPIMSSIVQSRQIWYQAKDLPEDLVEDTDGEEVGGDKEGKEESTGDVDGDVDEDVDEDVEDVDEDVDGNTGADEDDDMLNFHLSGEHEIKHLKPKNLEDIDEVDAEEKRHRRRTLGFYTSKIDQREKKKFTKFQGDEDIPYKERLFERQQRLIEEARKRGDRGNKNAPGADLDDEDMNEDDMKVANSVNGTEDATGEDYYEKVKSHKAARKAARRHAHEEAVRAARSGKLAELSEKMDENGKRAINYQFLKNRGLTKKRKKENRNARVKKRRKFAKAQKKLKSVRAVYQTPEGPYQGEKSGIKKNITRSVKLV